MNSLGFFIHKIVPSASKDSFYFFFSKLDAFYFILLPNCQLLEVVRGELSVLFLISEVKYSFFHS